MSLESYLYNTLLNSLTKYLIPEYLAYGTICTSIIYAALIVLGLICSYYSRRGISALINKL